MFGNIEHVQIQTEYTRQSKTQKEYLKKEKSEYNLHIIRKLRVSKLWKYKVFKAMMAQTILCMKKKTEIR